MSNVLSFRRDSTAIPYILIFTKHKLNANCMMAKCRLKISICVNFSSFENQVPRISLHYLRIVKVRDYINGKASDLQAPNAVSQIE